MTTYPTPATLNGQKVTVDWLMNNPTVIYRSLRTLVQQRLIGDKLLAGRVDATGSGSVIFGVSEGIFPKRSAERTAPGAEYPLTDDDPGVPANVAVDKWTLATEFPQELVARNRIDIVNRKLLKITNQVVFGFDSLTLSAVASAITQTVNATAAWNTSNADQFLDTMLMAATVDSLNQGFETDVVALSPIYFARLVAAAKILDHTPREGNSAIVITGRMVQIAGMTFWKTTNLPPGVNVMAVDSTQLGSIATERLGGPGWSGSPDTVETKLVPLDKSDGWRLMVRKVAVPFVQEPGAGVKLLNA